MHIIEGIPQKLSFPETKPSAHDADLLISNIKAQTNTADSQTGCIDATNIDFG